MAWAASALRAVEGTAKGFASVVCESREKFVDHFADDHPCGLHRLFGHGGAQGHQIGHEVDVGFERGKELGLEHQGFRADLPGRGFYGAEEARPRTHDCHIERLRSRHVGAKRSLASREFALGIEPLERFVRKESLRLTHECVFGVLALESEPVDPRL
ncbi:MAG TPA: hypothetical protein VFD98_06830 [Terracidiphilus sp.]|nr:hypothetical protein [Terracidiphilus sp.]